MPLYNNKFTTSTEQAVADAAAKAQKYAQDALRSSSMAEVYYNQMVGIGVQAKDFARLDGANFTGPVTFSENPTVNGEPLVTLNEIGPSIEYNFSYSTFEALVNGGDAAHKKGTIYFIPVSYSSGGPDYYDEYVWIPAAGHHELIGNTRVNLDGYATKTYVDTEYSALRSEAMSWSAELQDDLGALRVHVSNTYYSIARADTLFLKKIDAASTYAEASDVQDIRSDLYALQAVARPLYSSVNEGTEANNFSFTRTDGNAYSWSEQNLQAVYNYTYSEPFANIVNYPIDRLGSGTILFRDTFSIGGDSVEWGLHALAPNADGTYGVDGYVYVCKYTLNSIAAPGGKTYRTTLDLIDMYYSDQFSS